MAKRRKSLYLLLAGLRSAASLFPFGVLHKFGKLLGLLVYYSIPKHKNIAIDNLKKAFPEKTEKEIRTLARECFINHGKSLVEFICSFKLKGKYEDFVEVKGRENIKPAFDLGKGVIVLAAHFGNWELIGMGLCMLGVPLQYIARKVYIEELEKMLTDIRMSYGARGIITRGENDAPVKIVRSLKKNEAMAMLIDQNVKSIPGVYVNFFGRKTYTPSGLAAIAMKTNAAVLPCFIIRNKNNKHTLEISPHLNALKTNDKEKDILVNTQRFSDIIESYIKKYPEQWVWFHERWN